MRFLRPTLCLGFLLLFVTPAHALTARQPHQTFYVYGHETDFSAYSVEGNNYIRARDFAYAVNCSLEYDPNTASIHLQEGQPYDHTTETIPVTTTPTASAHPTRQKVYINGALTNIQGYSIGGYNYFKLRDLGKAFGWSVLYNGAQGRVELNPEYPYFEKNNNTIVYMYHAFTNDPILLAAQPDLYTSPWKFRQDIQEMRRLGYENISLEAYYNGKAEAGKKYFIITIDDGYLNNYQLAYPVLVEENAHASIFTVVREMERSAVTHFTVEQAKEMEASGHVSVYAHNMDHMDATKFTTIELDALLNRAYSALHTHLGNKNLFFAYPYGAYNENTYVQVRDHGFHLQMVQESLFPADDILVRKNVRYDSSMSTLVQQAYHN